METPADQMKLWPADLGQMIVKAGERLTEWVEAEPGGLALLIEEVKTGRSLCWASDEAFVVLSIAPAPDGKRDLFIRAGVSFENSEGAFERHMPAIAKIAVDMGASRVRFRSRRPGWERKLQPPWRLSHTEWVCEVGFG